VFPGFYNRLPAEPGAGSCGCVFKGSGEKAVYAGSVLFCRCGGCQCFGAFAPAGRAGGACLYYIKPGRRSGRELKAGNGR